MITIGDRVRIIKGPNKYIVWEIEKVYLFARTFVIDSNGHKFTVPKGDVEPVNPYIYQEL